MQGRFFEYLFVEICVAINQRISRYDLWLRVWDGGGDPDELNHDQVRHFIEHYLTRFLTEEGQPLAGRRLRRLEKRLLRFNPDHPTPEEWMTRIFEVQRKKMTA